MKEKREKYEKSQSVAIEMEQPLLSGSNFNIGIGGVDNKPGPGGAPRYEGEDDWDE